MNEAPFFEPYVQPWTTRVLGVELKPYALGHKLLLHSIKSSFVTGEPHTFADLAASVFICSRTYRDAVDAFHSPELARAMAKWAQKCGVFDFAEKCNLFERYLEEGDSVPTHQYPATDGKNTGCPLVQTVKVALMSELNFQEKEVLDRPWRLCLLDYLTWAAMQGRITFTDDDEIAEALKVGEMLAEKMKEGKIGQT